MATNYVDYDYWVYGYGDDDLTAPELYVTAGYWDAGYAENEGGASAAITGTATVTAKAVDYYLGTASITGNATVTAVAVIDLYVKSGYWVAGYCENEPLEPSASVNGYATVTALGTKTFTGIASVTGNAQVGITVANVKVGTGSITGNANVTAKGSYTVGAKASVTGNATVNAIGTGVFDVPMSFSGNATVVAIGDIIGYEWSNVTARSSTWTDTGAGYVDYGYWEYGYTNADLAAPIANVWQQASAASTSWARQ